MITDKSVRTAEAEMVQQVFGPINAGELPTALAAALARLTEVAVTMRPDDIALTLDMASGILNFRAYRRAERT